MKRKRTDFLTLIKQQMEQEEKDGVLDANIQKRTLERDWWASHIPRGKFPANAGETR